MRMGRHYFSSDRTKKGLFGRIIGIAEKEGFYLVLFVCFCIVAGTAVWTIKSNFEKIDSKNNIDNIELAKEPEQDTSDRAAAAEVSQTIANKEAPKQEKANIAADNGKIEQKKKEEAKVSGNSLALVPPVEGKLILEYADDKLVYSKTLDQYVVHYGIDIEAPLNAPVCAVADGIVLKVFDDAKMGKTIWISHSKDFITKYSNLSVTNMVEVGDAVKKGDVISGVGNTALFETLDAPHLHFEVQKGGKNEDPLKYFPKYKKH